MPCVRRAWLRVALVACSGALAACVPVEPEAPEPPGEAETEADWNDAAIAWLSYEDGIARARAEQRPVLLVFYTDWCPHCHNYSRVFHDPEVVSLARRFLMIRVERDGHRELSGRYNLDGEYIPRTFFLTPTGEVRSELQGNSPAFRYFLDEHEPRHLITLMQRALVPSRTHGAGAEPSAGGASGAN